MRPGGERRIASMLMSIATVSISGSLDAKLRAIHDARFQGVEIFENDLLSFGGSAPEVGGLIRDLGLTCTCFQPFRDRKSTRLNSSHSQISYAVFCLKKKTTAHNVRQCVDS